MNCSLQPLRRVTTALLFAGLILFTGAHSVRPALALEIPRLGAPINDFAKIFPQASHDDLEERLKRFKTQTAHTVIVVTIPSLENENIESVSRGAFKSLPLEEKDLRKAVLLLVARNERQAAIQVGSELRQLFPEPEATRKILGQVSLYFDGLRPDLGIHGGVSYIFRIIRGEIYVGRKSAEEKFEDASTRGAGAGPLFAIFLAPFLAFFVGVLWGIGSTHHGIQREVRLFIGAVLGGGTAKIVSTLMAALGSIGDGLWYFILVISIILGVFGSLTEFWMQGEWRGIPRVKDESLRRKPRDKMGI
jgi:uncharacterized protein